MNCKVLSYDTISLS